MENEKIGKNPGSRPLLAVAQARWRDSAAELFDIEGRVGVFDEMSGTG